MNRNVTAVYRTHAVADLVRQELEDLGISRSNIHVIPDTNDVVATGAHREDRRWMDQLHELHLPDDDVRTYQQCVRRGDYVVSANVDDDYVQRAQQIMRRPEAEAYDLNARSGEFRDEAVIVHSDTTRSVSDPRYVGQRDTDYTDPYVRSYRRDTPLGTRR
jgi:hypothetical protein